MRKEYRVIWNSRSNSKTASDQFQKASSRHNLRTILLGNIAEDYAERRGPNKRMVLLSVSSSVSCSRIRIGQKIKNVDERTRGKLKPPARHANASEVLSIAKSFSSLAATLPDIRMINRPKQRFLTQRFFQQRMTNLPLVQSNETIPTTTIRQYNHRRHRDDSNSHYHKKNLALILSLPPLSRC